MRRECKQCGKGYEGKLRKYCGAECRKVAQLGYMRKWQARKRELKERRERERARYAEKKAVTSKPEVIEANKVKEDLLFEVQKRFMRLFESSPYVWGVTYCARHFPVASPGFHGRILREAGRVKYLAIAAPRSSAKSTILSFLKPLHSVAFRKKHFIVICQNTYAKAARTLENIKAEFKDNEMLRKDFPVKIVKDAEGDSIFKGVGGYETRVLSKGADQIGAIRGEKFGPYRPDLIIIDDLEDDELVRSAERRRVLCEMYDEALIPSGDTENLNVIAIGTILHDDSLMAKLVSADRYTEYVKFKYMALYIGKGGERVSLWPEKWSVEDLKKLEQEKPSVFAKEYQNDPSFGMMSDINREDFRYWKIENQEYVLFGAESEIVSRGTLADCKAAIACDLAWEEKRENDYTVIMPGFLTPQSDLLIETYIMKKGIRPEEIEEILFSMEGRLRAITGRSVPIGFEKAKLEKVIKHLLKQAMRRRNRWLIFKDLAWDTDKIQRIITRLQPRYAQHSIYHRRGMGDLEGQLVRLRSTAHDDAADCAQGLVQLLEYPVQVKKAATKDDAFEWYRQRAIEARHPKRKEYVFGEKGRRYVGVPAKLTYR